jgi:4'-phosphopantetheinyl transferase
MAEVWSLASLPHRHLGPRDVDVWAVALSAPPERVAALRRTLSEDERERADRFYFERDRRRFTCARGVLRSLLGAYLEVDARDVTFTYGPHGKPALSGRYRGALTFNVSHSHELAVMAIGRNIEMGIDVEAVRAMDDGDDIASRFFSLCEAAQLRGLPAGVRTTAFFACWTRKEAYLKALGSGLAKPLDGFDVTFAPGETPALFVRDDVSETARWSISALSPAAGYAGAIVTEGCVTLRCWRWVETDERAALSAP